LAITNGYATLTQVKAAMRITDNIDDTLIEMAVESASRAIDGFAMRSFYSSGTATRYYAADDSYVVQTDDIAGTAITLQTSSAGDGIFDTTWAVIDYQLEPNNGYTDGLSVPYTRIRAVENYLFPVEVEQALVKVTAVFGWPAVPIAITQACVIQSSRLFKRLDSPLGVAGFGDMGAVRVSRYLDPDVEQLIAPYRKTRNFA
jgi:Phage gp6-like head-tail connector protein